jgi:thiol-disulfide isomerase/thioredoxin
MKSDHPITAWYRRSAGRMAILLLALASVGWSWPFGDANVPHAPYSAPEAVIFTGSGASKLSQFKGRKVMLWLFSTWCHTCATGLDALAQRQTRWHRDGLTIIAVRNYRNGGYPGPTIEQFMRRFGASVARAPNWVSGEASEQMDHLYNAGKYPDIYYLIDEQGVVRATSTAPAVTMETIVKFAEGHMQ